MMEMVGDPKQRVKEDNASIANFLTLCTSDLFDFQKISQQEVDHLRVTLSDVGTSSDRHVPLLLTLSYQNHEFLALLMHRYGSQRLAENIFRYTLISEWNKFQFTLTKFAEALLKKTELFLHRSLRIYDQSRYIDDELAAHVIIRVCSQLQDSMIEGTRLGNTALCFHGSRYEPQIDQKIALHLGMSPLEDTPHSGHPLRTYTEKLQIVILECLSTLSHFNRQFFWNKLMLNPLDVRMSLQSLHDLAEKLTYTPPEKETWNFKTHLFADFDGLMGFELSRQFYMNNFASLNTLLKTALNGLIFHLKAVPQKDPTGGASEFELSEVLRKTILFEMMLQGSKAQDAQRAVRRLEAYLADHHVHPENILLGELSRIDSLLDSKTIELIKKSRCYATYLSTHSSGVSALLDNHEKSDLLKKSKELGQCFYDTISKLSPLMLLLVFTLSSAILVSCGLKANPKSDIPSLRPEIPFKERPVKKIEPSINNSKIRTQHLKDQGTISQQIKNLPQKP